MLARVEDRHPRPFHGRRGRRLRPAQRALVDSVLPQVLVSMPPPGERLDPRTLFPTARAVWLEIGFGGGEHLIWQVSQTPGVGIIGADVYLQGIARLLKRVENRDAVRLFRGDARALLDLLPEQSLDRVFLLFPDPWPKARHQKRRFVQPETVARLAGVMKDGVELRLATDDMSYARWMMTHLAAHADFEWLAEGPEDWRRRPADWPETRYETKAIAAGRTCVYLRFRRRPRSVVP